VIFVQVVVPAKESALLVLLLLDGKAQKVIQMARACSYQKLGATVLCVVCVLLYV
jgi:hypothetical protein